MENDADREFLYWLCFGLWQSKSFHLFLRGSVIPFITIHEMRKHLMESELKVSNKVQAFEKSIQALRLLEIQEEKIKVSLKMFDAVRQSIFYKLLHDTGAD